MKYLEMLGELWLNFCLLTVAVLFVIAPFVAWYVIVKAFLGLLP